MYKSILNKQETEHAIKLVKDTFQQELSRTLKLRRVTAPLFVKSDEGLNDDLNGWETPVTFKDVNDQQYEIVHSLAKWKRIKCAEEGINPGYGIYTDMNAIRCCENVDDIHSMYVDQWDWEKVITKNQRILPTLHIAVKEIYNCLKNTEYVVCEHYPQIKPFLPNDVYLLHACFFDKNKSKEENEQELCKKYGAIFITGIDYNRAPDYDDWTLNGDIMIWVPWLNKGVELSSMGIRVDAEVLKKQLEASGKTDRLKYKYHQQIINNEIPLTIGGGIGQSRLCMILLHKMHIGEVQVSQWPDTEINNAKNNGIEFLK